MESSHAVIQVHRTAHVYMEFISTQKQQKLKVYKTVLPVHA